MESLFLSFSQRRREIETDNALDGSQKERLLSSSAKLLRAQLGKLREGGLDRVIEAGLAGGATLRRQILGVDGQNGTQSPVVQRIDTIIQMMDRLINKGGTTAVAAP